MMHILPGKKWIFVGVAALLVVAFVLIKRQTSSSKVCAVKIIDDSAVSSVQGWQQQVLLDLSENITINRRLNNSELYMSCPPQFHVSSMQSKELLKTDTHITDRILILTPISNSGKHLHHFFSMICSLDYPNRLISVAFGEDSSRDGSYETALELASQLNNSFQRIQVFHFKENMMPLADKHAREFQFIRRSHLAKSRNMLLSRALRDEDWILWLDSDIKHIPSDLITQLLSTKKDIVVPSCMREKQNGQLDVYDRNTWQETKVSRDFQESKDASFLMLEGYGPSARKFLPNMGSDGPIVRLDGVGGCALLVKADCHRKGLIFPSFVFEHHIETEGFGKMATRMGFAIYGIPNLYVIHS